MYKACQPELLMHKSAYKINVPVIISRCCNIPTLYRTELHVHTYFFKDDNNAVAERKEGDGSNTYMHGF